MSDRLPVNQLVPPFGRTAHGIGTILEDVRAHGIVQHPNPGHGPMPAATPFLESAHALSGWRGRARHWPGFTAGNGLVRGVRK